MKKLIIFLFLCALPLHAQTRPHWLDLRETPAIDARTYGLSESSADNRAALQAAVDAAKNAGGGTVIVPGGDYSITMVAALPTEQYGLIGIRLASNTSLVMQPDTHISIAGTNATTYAVIGAQQANNVSIYGGKITGDIDIRTGGASGEQGIGIWLENCSNVKVDRIIIEKCWGDGIFIGSNPTVGFINLGENIIIRDVVADNNRRQGISVVSGSNISIENCVLKNTGRILATNPSAGIDIEPETTNGYVVSNVTVSGCTLFNNVGEGILVTGTDYSDIRIVDNHVASNTKAGIQFGPGSDAVVSGNTVTANLGPGIAGAYSLVQPLSNIVISNNKIKGNGWGILGTTVATAPCLFDSVITGNAIVDNTVAGISLYGPGRCTISDNNIQDTTNNGLEIVYGEQNVISGNLIYDSGLNGVSLVGSNELHIVSNTINYSGSNGVLFDDTTNVKLSGNRMIGNCKTATSTSAINVGAGSIGQFITDNYISGSGLYGVSIGASASVDILNNHLFSSGASASVFVASTGYVATESKNIIATITIVP